MECLGFQLPYLICFVSGFNFIFFPYCPSWLFLLSGWTGVCKGTIILWLFPVGSTRPGGRPLVPSGAPLMSHCLSMGLRGHMHKVIHSHLFVARDTNFESGRALCAKILSKLWESGEFCLFSQPGWVISGFSFCLVVPVLVLVLSQWKSELPLISKIQRYRMHLFPF